MIQTDMLDISASRSAKKYSAGQIVARGLWSTGSLFFRFSPRPFFGWRNFILRLFGAKIGRNVHIYSSAVIYMPWNLEIGDWSSIGEHALIYNLGKITIGKSDTISQRAHLCAGTHDHTDPAMPLLKPPITVCDQAWICTDAYVGPGVSIGEGAVVAARAVVVKDVDPWQVVGGNPAKLLGRRMFKQNLLHETDKIEKK